MMSLFRRGPSPDERTAAALEKIAYHVQTISHDTSRIEGHLRALRTEGLLLRLPREAAKGDGDDGPR